MLGKGWFPTELGGLDRYYRDLLQTLPEARGVVIGPANDAPERVTVVSSHDAALWRRLLMFALMAKRNGRDVDVIDAHFALYSLLALAVRRRGTPVVVHFQGPWADENVAAGEGSRVKTALRRQLERWVYRRAETVIVLTAAFGELAVRTYGVDPARVRVLAPGVDLERFSPGERVTAREAFGVEADAFCAVCVRRLVARMGIDVLIEAWREQLDELGPGAVLLIAGDGELRPALEAAAARPELGGSVRLLGRISDDALVSLYRAADVNVVPSLSFEGFGLVVIEAAAAGTPSITADAGGLAEAVAGLDTGLVVAANDVEALGARIARAARGELPSRPDARAFAERHDWRSVGERHRAVYRAAVRASKDESAG